MLVRHRWVGVDLQALEAKCREVGLNDEDTKNVLDLMRKVKAGRRLVHRTRTVAAGRFFGQFRVGGMMVT